MTSPDQKSAAVWYAEMLGWQVFPVHSVEHGRCSCGATDCSDAGKHPRTLHGLKDATRDAAQIDRWWSKWPDANIGLATGEPSGVDVLDVDPRACGSESLWNLERQHAELQQTVTSLTGGGGSHLFFRHAPGLKNSASEIAPGLDFKTTGGYVVLPPSAHSSGRHYTWEGAGRPTEVEVAAFPEWLLKLLRNTSNSNGNGHQAPPIPDKIPKGQQHATLVSFAGSMRRRGAGFEEILAALLVMNERRCMEPGTLKNIRRIAESICKYKPHSSAFGADGTPDLAPTLPSRRPPDSTINLVAFPFTDTGNAERLVALHGHDLRFCADMKKWGTWDGRRWVFQDSRRVKALAKRTMRLMYLQAADIEDKELREAAEKHARKSESAAAINAMLSCAEYEDGILVAPDELDTDPYLLNFLNRTVDLRTGALRPHRREDLITKLIHYEYHLEAVCPLWLTFLDQAMGGGPDASESELDRARRLMEYLQRALGYSLTGCTIEKAVFVPFGPPDTGKSTMLCTIRNIVKEYSTLLQVDTLMTRQESNNTQADLADLRGARFVQTSETEEGQRLAQGKLKRISQGMGEIKATKKFENPITFPETHKLWIDTNKKPVIRDAEDRATFNRLHPIPFTVKITKIDRDMPAKLLREAPGILAWLVEGAKRWHESGLQRPPEVEAARNQWRAEMDKIGRFIEERCIIADGLKCPAAALYAAYKSWAEASGEKEIMNSMVFGVKISERDGINKCHSRSGTVYSGIGLRGEPTEEKAQP